MQHTEGQGAVGQQRRRDQRAEPPANVAMAHTLTSNPCAEVVEEFRPAATNELVCCFFGPAHVDKQED